MNIGNQCAAAGSSCDSRKAVTFFSSLHACLRPGAAAVAQFYPRNAAQAQVGLLALLFTIMQQLATTLGLCAA